MYSKTTFVTVNRNIFDYYSISTPIQKQLLLLLISVAKFLDTTTPTIQKQLLLLLIAHTSFRNSIISYSKTTFVTVNLVTV